MLLPSKSARSSRPRRAPFALLRQLGIALPLMLISLALLAFAFVRVLGVARPDVPGAEVPLSVLLDAAARDRIDSVTMLDYDGRISWELGGDAVWSAYPRSDAATEAILTALGRGGAEVIVDQQNGKRQAVFLAQFVLPLLLLANLFGLLFVAGKSGGARDLKIFSRMLGKKGKKRQSGVTFADVAGAGSSVLELREIVDYLADPTQFAAVGAVPPKGVLLVGPPGCGKTLLARAVAGEADAAFYSISGSEFVASLVGGGAARGRDLFRQAHANAPASVFIDELDAAGRRRGAGVGGGHDER